MPGRSAAKRNKTSGVNRPKRSKSGPKPARRRRNLRAAEREKMILESAIRFFAEHGFEGQTRELAKRVGITHSAIYRHFSSKEALIERVYEHVYLGSWQRHWAGIITDRSRPIEERLTQFYREYTDQIFKFDWVRIFIYAGLKSFDIDRRYLQVVMDTVGIPTLLEARHEFGLPAIQPAAISQRERELFWGLHGRFFYIAIRKFVYGVPSPDGAERHSVIADGVREFVCGARDVLTQIAKDNSSLG